MRYSSVWLLTLIIASALFFAFENPTPSNKIPSKQEQTEQQAASNLADSALKLYEQMSLEEEGLAFATFQKALKGYFKLESSNKLSKQLLSIVDMSQPSKEKRLYIIDMPSKKLLVHTLVAHGRNSGEYSATKFSNTPSSLQSSLGFYITGDTYMGNNGYSLRLKGLEKGFNDKAESRAIVMHGAAYVNEDVAQKTGRVGRSWGCPAISMKEHKQIIDLVKNGSCLFIYAPVPAYIASSSFVNDSNAVL